MRRKRSQVDKLYRFSIRKTSLCVGSVIVGMFLTGAMGPQVLAEELAGGSNHATPNETVGDINSDVSEASALPTSENQSDTTDIVDIETISSRSAEIENSSPSTPVDSDVEAEVSSHGPLPTEAQLDYHKEELAAFIHFGMNTFTDAEWGNGKEKPQNFNPTELDTDQWISELKNAGFKRTIMVVKHHDGFVLYPSAHTEHDVASSPWKDGKGDVLKELSDSASKYDMNLGVYLSPWDANHPKYSVATQDDYNKYYLDQLKEILGNPQYGNKGKFVEVWMDGARGDGAQKVNYTFEEWFKYIKEAEGDIAIFSAQPTSIRWIGNESGIAGDPVWHKVKKDRIVENVPRAYLNNGDPNGDMYSVGEADVSIRPGWFYHENQKPKSIKDLMNIYFKSVGRGTPLLLNIPPDKRGKFADADVARLREFKATLDEMYRVNHATNATIEASSTRKNPLYSVANLLDGKDDTAWAPAKDAKTGHLTIDLGEPKTFDVIEIKEQISKGQRISNFNIEVEINGKWVTYATGHTVGYRRLLQGQPITAQKIRVTITDAQATPLISNIAVYKTPKAVELTDGFPLNMAYLSNTTAQKEQTWHQENEGIRGSSMWTNREHASASYTFKGTKAYVVSTVDPNHGVMEVYIDGVKTADVDTQRSQRKRSQLVYETPDLTYGEHTIKLVRKTKAVATEGIYFVDNQGAGMFVLTDKTKVAEKGKPVTLTVKRIAGTEGQASVKVVTLPGTGVHGQVYKDTVETLTFAPGETSKTVTIPLIDYSGNASFDFKVKLQEASGTTFIGLIGETDIQTVAREDLPEGKEYDDRDGSIVYHGNWREGNGLYKGTEKWLNFTKAGSAEAKQDISYDVYFRGTGISTFGVVDPGHGIYEVLLDGKVIDFTEGSGNASEASGKKYFSGIGNPRKAGVELIKLRGLDSSLPHVLTVRLDPKKNNINGTAGMQLDKVQILGAEATILRKDEIVSIYTGIKTKLEKIGNTLTSEEQKNIYKKKLADYTTKLTEAHLPLEELNKLASEIYRLLPSTTLSNLALNRPATASSQEKGTSHTAENAFDGNAESRFSSGQMKSNKDANTTHTPQWLEVDLGAEARITAVEVDFYKKVYSTDYTLSTSNDRNTWIELSRSSKLDASSTTEHPKDSITFAQPKEVGRYLRLTFNHLNHHAAGTGVSVTEVRILGQLKGNVAQAVNPLEKLNKATLEVSNGRVRLTNIEEDQEYSYEIIGSANQYLVSHDGQVSSYNLNDQDVTMLVAARKRSTNELVNASKINKIVRIVANHSETVKGTNLKPQLALDIQEFLAGEGTTTLNKMDKVYIDPTFAKQLQLFNEDLHSILGFGLTLGTEADAKVVFKLTDQYNLKDEGYLMRIGDKVEVYAADAKAFNYAAVTLAQMLQKDGELTRGVYRDYPNYAIRGMLLDVARIPMRMDFLKDVSKLFRWYKLNELHLHFNDNQWPKTSKDNVEGWKVTEAAHRLESNRFPSLHKTEFKHDRYEGEYDFYRNNYGNPSYSRDAFRLFQADSNAAAINILAEFDTPGHSAAYSLYALENPDKIDYLGQPIHHPNDLEALAINKEKYPERTARAKKFVKELITDYLDDNLFTYGHIHLGVDEYWQKNGNVESFLAYMNELNDLAKSKGKILRTWGALSQFRGKTPVSKDIVFDEWAQYESLTMDRINEGYKVVNVPQPFTYVTPGRNHKDIINEQFVFEHWRPTVFNLNHNNKRQEALLGEPLLLGAKGALWGDEHTEGIEESDLYHRLEKSLSMIGYKTWGGTQNRSYLDYQRAREATKLNHNYLPVDSKTEVLVHINAEHITTDRAIDLSGNGHTIQTEGELKVVELDKGKWFHFTGENSLLTDIETIGLPYTLEMTIKPTDVMTGSLLLSRDGAIYLNKKGRTQAGEVTEGLMFNRYFYSQHIRPHLEVGKEYRLTFAATRQVLNVYINGEKVATYAHQNESGKSNGSESNLRTSFNLPFKEIGKGFKGYIKDIKVYNRTSSVEEIEKETLNHLNIALHKPVYDYRHHSDFWNQDIRPYNKDKITDGDIDAGEGRWNSSNHDEDYFIIDLGQPQTFSHLTILFDKERPATDFKVLVSDDLATFTEIYTQTGNQKADLNILINQQTARYVKFESKRRKAGKNEIAVKELRVYQNVNQAIKTSLAKAFSMKKVSPENSDWITVFNTLHNKYASSQDIEISRALLAKLADKGAEPIVETPNQPQTSQLDNAKYAAIEALNLALEKQIAIIKGIVPATEENKEKAIQIARELIKTVKAAILTSQTEAGLLATTRENSQLLKEILPLVERVEERPVVVDLPSVQIQIEEVPVTVTIRDNPNLEKGQVRVLQEGKVGQKRTLIQISYDTDGNELVRTIIGSEMTIPMQERILEQGSMEPFNNASSQAPTEELTNNNQVIVETLSSSLTKTDQKEQTPAISAKKALDESHSNSRLNLPKKEASIPYTSKVTKNKLPETGQVETEFFVALGASLLGASLFLANQRRKKSQS